MSKFRTSNRGAYAFMAIVVLLIAGPTISWAQIEEVVVTTRKREENLQKVPIAVTAIGAEQIEIQGINSLEKVVNLDPSVSFQNGYNDADTRVIIRGLSPTRGRANVAFLVDGIDTTSENTIAAGAGLLANRRLLNDVERIEIVKGSQSALFGRSAFTGAISYTTKEPGDTFESNVRIDASDYGRFDLGGALGGPVFGLQDVLGFRLNGVYWSDEGFYENSVSGNAVGGGDGYGAALVGVWTPSEFWKIKARVEYSDDHYNPPANVRIQQGVPVPYPDDAVVESVGLAGGYSNTTAGMPDHGLYCSEILPAEMTDRNERQLTLGGMFPDYPRIVTTDDPSTPDIIEPYIDPGTGQPARDGAGNLIYTDPTDEVLWRRPLQDGTFLADGVTPIGPDPLKPGFCLPDVIAATPGQQVTQSENPQTGNDWGGTDLETFRATLKIDFDRSYGTFTSNSGYTQANGDVSLDQDWRAVGRPDTLLQSQGGNTQKDVEQFSQEFRFASSWENSPAQLTLGGLWWKEERDTNEKNFIADCFLTGKNLFGLRLNTPGLCDGADADGNVGGPGTTVDSWQAYMAQLLPYEGSTWEADTDHLSIYGMLEFELADSWKLTLEDRWVIREEFTLNKPNFSSCTNFAFGLFGGEILPGAWLDESENPGFNALCTAEGFTGAPIMFEELPPNIQAHYMPPNVDCVNFANVQLPGYPLKTNGIDPLEPYNGSANNAPLSVDTLGCPYGNIKASETSDWHAPKITLEWEATDDAIVFASWARSIKPGGFNQVSAGGAATSIDEEHFEPEIMDYWELGTKTSWEVAGALRLNGSIFFQDYTDKQIGTQILVPDGSGGFRSSPRVINASAAEVWGIEFDVTWMPEAVEGLILSAAYTHLDATYTNFIDETTTFVRAGEVGSCPVVWKDGNNVTVAEGTTNPNPDPDNPLYAPKCALNLSGNQLELSPENAFVGRVNLTRPLAETSLDWFVGLEAIYQGERFVDSDNFTKLEEYWLLDLRAGLMGDKWDMVVYVDNALDDDTIRGAGSGPDFGPGISDMGFSAGLVRTHFFGPLPPPRVIGVRLNVRFGS